MPEQSKRRVRRRQFIKGLAATGMFGVGVGSTPSVLASDHQQIPEGRQHPLRVMSYNIHRGAGTDGNYNLRRVADVISAADPDVVALQEVDQYWASRSNFDNQPELLSEWLDMELEFYKYYNLPPEENGPDKRRRFGDAILSKYPILQRDEYIYSNSRSGRKDRKLAVAKINVEGAHLWFNDVHLQAGRSDGAQEARAIQIRETLEKMRQQNNPKIVAGDFNAPSGRYVSGRGSYSNPENYQILNDALVDVLRETGDADFTFPAPGKDTFERRIDYIFTTENIGIVDGEVIASRASDHKAIVADFVLTRGRNSTH
jgi:endonuclease/exonuclease/phosphatase family metal-dependent hydrolase